MKQSPYAYSKQPWKFLYYATQIPLLFLFRLPSWILLNLPSSFRPHPSWPLQRVLKLKILKLWLTWRDNAGPLQQHPTFEAITDGEGVLGVWVNPVPELVVGEIKQPAETNGVSGVPIPGYWINKPDSPTVKPGATPLPGEKVIYCLHGGGYVHFSAHPSDYTSHIPRGILQYCPSITRAFSIEYRLTKGPPFKANGSFPSALLDALAGYVYLVKDVGFEPNDIIVEGDSAGGNLALALVRYLTQYPEHLPQPPSSLILLSPFADLGRSHHHSETFQQNIITDYITHPNRLDYLTSAFTGSLDPKSTETNPYFSPGSINPVLENISFAGFPKTLVLAGEHELIKDSIVHLKDKMARQLGDGQVTYIEIQNAVHDIIIVEFYEPERTYALHAVAQWISSL